MVSRLNADNSSAPEKPRLGRYGLMATLGQGGMGTIHLAVASGLGEFRKLMVVKELRRDLARNDRFVAMFLAEAKLAARLSHPNIVHTLEADKDGDRYFLSMEFLDGQPFIELLRRAAAGPVVPLMVRLQVLCEVLAGLHYAHELCDYDGSPFRIVHRDVSPANVFITYDGQVKLVDFGIAKAVDADNLTNPGVFKGKFPYASPEQVKGQPTDARTDVFGVGVMLWEAVCLRRFAPGIPTQASIGARIRGDEPRLAQASPGVDPRLAEICDRATHVDLDKRYASAEEFRAALQRFVLANGDMPSAAVIAEIMRGKFAAERGMMHRLIDAHIKDGDLSESVVRDLRTQHRRSGGGDFNDDLLTPVADLTRLIEESRIDNPIANADVITQPRIAWTPAPFEPMAPARKPWVTLGLTALLLIAAGWIWLQPTAAPTRVAAPAPSAPAAVVTPLPAARAADVTPQAPAVLPTATSRANARPGRAHGGVHKTTTEPGSMRPSRQQVSAASDQSGMDGVAPRNNAAPSSTRQKQRHLDVEDPFQ
jgi:serine/threonine protein kinase